VWCKAEISASLLQSSVSHDPSKIILHPKKCWAVLTQLWVKYVFCFFFRFLHTHNALMKTKENYWNYTETIRTIILSAKNDSLIFTLVYKCVVLSCTIYSSHSSYTTETASPWKPIFKYSLCFAAIVTLSLSWSTIVHCWYCEHYRSTLITIFYCS